jgi:uncharacterized protein YdaU (DUF1376 family)
MSKLPYIPLYVGDWLKDTDCISLECEGALLKLIFKMWESKEKGILLSISFSQLSILFKKSEEITRNIIAEMHENNILDIEFMPENRVKIQSRRMVREANKSLKLSENGKKGGRPAKEKKQIESKTKANSKAKQKLLHDIDNDIEVDNEYENKEKMFSENFINSTWQKWKDYRAGIKKPIKLKVSEDAAIKQLYGFSNGNESTAKAIIEKSIANGWQGLFELKESPQQSKQSLKNQALDDLANEKNI